MMSKIQNLKTNYLVSNNPILWSN